MKILETRTAKIELVEEGIVRLRFKRDIELDKADIDDNIKASVQLTGGRHCAILEVTGSAGITDKALKFAGSKQNAKYRLANALFIRSISVKLLWNFFSYFFKPTVQNRIFTNEKEAIKWLRGIYRQLQ